MASRYIIIFIIGAVAGTAYDYVHVFYHVLTYQHPDFVGTQLAFVPLEFGVSALAGTLVVHWLSRRFPAPLVSWRRTTLDGLLLLIAYLITGVLVGRNTLTFAALVPIAALSIATRPTPFVLLGSLLAAIVGPLSEICVSAAGIFHYVHGNPIPIWLPLLWMVAAGAFIDVPIALKVCLLQKSAR